MTTSRSNHSFKKLFGGGLAAALVLASCGSSTTEEEANAQPVTETSTVPAETVPTETTIAETPDTTIFEETLAENQVVSNNLIISVPEGWTSVVKGEDIDAKLAETNPALLAGLETSGAIEQLRFSSQVVDWIGISPQGETVNLLRLPLASASVEEMAMGIGAEIEAQGRTLISEEPYSGPLGSGVKITFEVITPEGLTASAESRVIESGDSLIIATGDGITPEIASARLDEIIAGTQLEA